MPVGLCSLISIVKLVLTDTILVKKNKITYLFTSKKMRIEIIFKTGISDKNTLTRLCELIRSEVATVNYFHTNNLYTMIYLFSYRETNPLNLTESTSKTHVKYSVHILYFELQLFFFESANYYKIIKKLNMMLQI